MNIYGPRGHVESSSDPVDRELVRTISKGLHGLADPGPGPWVPSIIERVGPGGLP